MSVIDYDPANSWAIGHTTGWTGTWPEVRSTPADWAFNGASEGDLAVFGLNYFWGRWILARWHAFFDIPDLTMPSGARIEVKANILDGDAHGDSLVFAKSTAALPPTGLTVDDYSAYEATELADRIPLANFGTDNWISTNLNAAGLEHFTTNGWAAFCLMLAADFDNEEPGAMGNSWMDQIENGLDGSSINIDLRLVIPSAAPAGFAHFF